MKLGMSIAGAFKTAMATWKSWVESKINTSRTRVFFRTFESTHWRCVWIIMPSIFSVHKSSYALVESNFAAKYSLALTCCKHDGCILFFISPKHLVFVQMVYLVFDKFDYKVLTIIIT